MKILILAAAVMLAAGAAGARTIDPMGGERDVVSIGHDAALAPGDSARDMVVIGGDADVSGAVERDLVVVAGSAKLGPQASVGRDVVVVAGTLDADPAASIGRNKTLISAQGLTDHLGAAKGLLAGSLLRARPLAPTFWVSWALGMSFLILYVLLAAAAPRVVEACAATLETRPVGAFLAGGLALAGLAPFCFLLVISILGIAVVPLVLLGVLTALVIGKAGLCRLIGDQVGHFGLSANGRPRTVLATFAGAAIMLTMYVIPFFGLFAWAMAVFFGFGAALLTAVDALQREGGSWKREPVSAAGSVPPPPPPAPAPAAAPASAPAAAGAEVLPRAGFWLRAAAFIIDVFAWGLIGGITHLHLLGLGGWAIYQVGMWVWKDTTLGGMVVGIKGARTDGRRMDVTVALVRHLASYLSALPMFLGFFWAGWDPEKQTWHDKIAGTIVVRVPHGQPLV